MLTVRCQRSIGSVHASPIPVMPALLHSTCAAPNRSSVNSARAATARSEDVSQTVEAMSAPSALNFAWTSARRISSMSARTTFIPSATNISLSAKPIPLAAPVTTATLPSRFFMWSSYETRSVVLGAARIHDLHLLEDLCVADHLDLCDQIVSNREIKGDLCRATLGPDKTRNA